MDSTGQAGDSTGPGGSVPVAPAGGTGLWRWTRTVPPHAYFVVAAVFHYLGPAFAVLLFARVDVLGVAWLRNVAAALVFAAWRRPWRLWARVDRRTRVRLVQLGAVLATMNVLFYLSIARLPLATVGAVEFLGVVVLAAAGARTPRNLAALALTVGGVAALTDVRLAGEPLGFALAFANCALFMLYVVVGHRVANTDAGSGALSGVDQLGAAVLIAAVAVTPVGLAGALPALDDPVLLLAGVGVGVCSSVIPYVFDQLAMARLPRPTFALMLALLPMMGAIIGAIVLRQVPTAQDVLGIALVVVGVAVHQTSGAERADRARP